MFIGGFDGIERVEERFHAMAAPGINEIKDRWSWSHRDNRRFLEVKFSVDGREVFRVNLKTLTCIVGRDSGGEDEGDGCRQIYGHQTYELAKNDQYSIAVCRPGGLPDFESIGWTLYDVTRISFHTLKRLSRTHFAITWNAGDSEWRALCMSNNGIVINDGKLKLRDGDSYSLEDGDSISAATQSVKLVISSSKQK